MRRTRVTGQVFGRLTILRETEPPQRPRRVICRCECGTVKEIQLAHLRSGATQSCGCYAREVARRSRRKHGLFVGQAHAPNAARTRLYTIWVNMRQRCSNPKAARYSRYGGRGIKVCAAWEESFEAFQDWATANGYRDDLSIDRIDNDGNYEPSNCRWADSTTQRVNSSRTHRIPLNGRTLTLTEASNELGIAPRTLRNAIQQHGMTAALQKYQEVTS